MQFFCYHRDRPGSTPLRASTTEEHWSSMDRFELVARGPTFLDDGARLVGAAVLAPVEETARAALAGFAVVETHARARGVRRQEFGWARWVRSR